MTKAQKIHIILTVMSDIVKDTVCANSAGAGVVWVANGDNVDTITVAADSNEVTAISFKSTTGLQIGWAKVQQDTDTLFATQTLAVPKKGTNVFTQQVGFEVGKLNPSTMKSISDMVDCALCNKLIFAVKDNNAKYQLFGVVLDGGADAFTLRGLAAAAGTIIQTGTDPTADSNGVIMVWEGTASKAAPFLTGITDESTFFPALSENA